jgi:hypothetical protein
MTEIRIPVPTLTVTPPPITPPMLAVTPPAVLMGHTALLDQMTLADISAWLTAKGYTVIQTPAPLPLAPEPPPPLLVPPTAPARTIAAYSDLSLVFVPANKTPAKFAPQFQTVTTPNGPGFAFVVADTDVTIWDNRMKAVLAKAGKLAFKNGETQQWDFAVYLPKQNIVTSWNGGVLWEFHSAGVSSGHHISLDNRGKEPAWRFGFQNAAGQKYTYGQKGETGPAVKFDTWHRLRINLKWSTAKDGFYTVRLNDTVVQNFTNVPTWFTADGGALPILQFGFYADIGAKVGATPAGTNQVTFAGITLT